MGAWGTDSFANDDAMDWIAELEARGLAATGGAFAAVDETADDYLDAVMSSCALAAAEVTAALHGRSSATIPEEIATWVAANPGDPGKALLSSARRIVDVVGKQSELRDLWEESDEFEIWRAELADLKTRLG